MCKQKKFTKLGHIMVEVCKGMQIKELPFMVGIGKDSKCFIEQFPLTSKIRHNIYLATLLIDGSLW